MLLLQPSMMLSSLWPPGGVGEAGGATRGALAGARVAMATPDPLLRRPFVQHVSVVARGGAVVVFLGQELR